MTKEDLKYDSVTKVSSKGTPILGRLSGPCADIIHATRNGRKYTEELWNKVFQNDIVNEMFECGGIFGELNHPADRSEVDLSQVCVCMPEKPKKNNEGQLIASWDILDTPNGRILKTLCDYGYKLGISSRGEGDIIEDLDGEEQVNPDTYTLNAWDVVLVPAMKAARLDYVAESLNSKKTLKQALSESLNNASVDDRRIMEETLKRLDIEYNSDGVDNIDVDGDTKAADNDGVLSVVEDLQNTLIENQQLKKQITQLQEKLSVSYAKESSLEDELNKYKSATINLSESAKNAKALKGKLDKVEQELLAKDAEIASKEQTISKLKESKTINSTETKSLKENLQEKSNHIKSLQQQISTLKESLTNNETQAAEKIQVLNEQIATLKKDSAIKNEEYTSKLSAQNSLVEKYKSLARKALDKYIESRATQIGVTKNEITNKLGTNYSFRDIDTICEDLRSYKVNISKLPFNVNYGQQVKMKVTESTEPLMPTNKDDTVDDQLLRMANIK